MCSSICSKVNVVQLRFILRWGTAARVLFLQRGRHWWVVAAALSAALLTAADRPPGDITPHPNVEEDVPIVLPNCNVREHPYLVRVRSDAVGGGGWGVGTKNKHQQWLLAVSVLIFINFKFIYWQMELLIQVRWRESHTSRPASYSTVNKNRDHWNRQVQFSRCFKMKRVFNELTPAPL